MREQSQQRRLQNVQLQQRENRFECNETAVALCEEFTAPEAKQQQRKLVEAAIKKLEAADCGFVAAHAL